MNAIGYDLLAQLKYTFTTNLKLHFHQRYQVLQTKATFVLFFFKPAGKLFQNLTQISRRLYIIFILQADKRRKVYIEERCEKGRFVRMRLS